MVRDALTLFPELTTDPNNATINVIVEDELQQYTTKALQASTHAKQAQAEASTFMHQAARELATQGLPYRDIGYLLGVSFQRAQKLATS